MRMNVTDLLPSHCEPEPAGRVWASRAVARAQACWPGDLSVAWPKGGALRVRLSAVAPVDQQSAAAVGLCESFSLWRTGRHGRLDVDARFASAVTSTLMAANVTMPMARALSPGERGVFAALIASVFDRACAPFQLAVDAPDAVPLRLDMQAELDLRFESENGISVVGWARLFLPAAWMDPSTVHWPHLARVPFPVVIELARTQIDGTSLGDLDVGDGLVFGGVEAFNAVTPLPVWVSLGLFRAKAQWSQADVRLQGPFEPSPGGFEGAATSPMAGALGPWKGTMLMTSTVDINGPGGAAASPNDAPGALLTQALANTPVEVVAEVGRLVLTGAELAGLGQGQVLSLGGSSRGAVTLSVAGRPVAKGVLVNIDGTFGVRVTERF